MKKDTDAGNEAVFAFRVTPGAKRNSVTALKEGVWCVKITAPPVEGKANEELVSFLSRLFDVRRSSVSVVKGQRSRSKLVCISGLTQKEVSRRLSAELDC
ncbi:MAG: YggU family protein [Dehalococcoidia bacterium]|nr:MAG: YggU family protein [Dehalococcoidia bacterium]